MSTSAQLTPPSRLVSLDALRGFDMFWILGADSLVVALGALSQSRPIRAIADQLEHKEWAGFAFYDLIFPLFVFIVGVSLVFSLTQSLARTPRATVVKRILRRAAILFVLGIFYNGGLSHAWPDVRMAGVLQRIALAYAATALLFCFCKPRQLAAAGVALLLGYWALMTFVPIRDFQLERHLLVERLPGVPLTSRKVPERAPVQALYDATTTTVTGRFDPGLNLADHLDFRFLPGAMHDGYYDPEGLLSTLPAIGTCLLGVFAGLCLQRADASDRRKLQQLLIAGAVCLAVGWLWNLQFPVIKKIWTSSYVLVAGGWSFLLLALFYYVVDVRQHRTWCQPFVWIGMNPITLYLASSVLSFYGVANRIVGGSIKQWFDAHLVSGAGGILVTLVSLLIV
ncbi:MAG: heparan-alpha-glucosaminide N-acetyltransferase domain-containing protein, partial [Opitutus sp.]